MRPLYILSLLLMCVSLFACEPFIYEPTPLAVVITNTPSPSPIPSLTPLPSLTPTASPSPTIEPTATKLPFICDDDAGQVIPVKDNWSELAQENLRYLVYIPPCYWQTSKRFPLVILFHGLSYKETQWQELGLISVLDKDIRRGALPPMVVVMPFMGTIGQLNQFPPQISYETVILEELLPDIERNFCTITNREHRAIGGISRGGFWAFSVAMRYPELFSKVGGHSAYFYPDTNAIPPAFNPLEIALNSSFLKDFEIKIHLDNGVSDSANNSQQTFSNRLSSRGIDHDYEVYPVGAHNNEYWASHIEEYVAFYAQGWEKDYEVLPDCDEPSP